MFILIIFYFLFVILMMFMVGITDAVEYQYINRKIYHNHNFPDILGRYDFQNLNAIDAFMSGVICSQVLLITFGAKCLILLYKKNKKIDIKDSTKYHLRLLLFLILGNGLILMTDNRKYNRLDRNHIWFYLFFGAVELLSIRSCFTM